MRLAQEVDIFVGKMRILTHWLKYELYNHAFSWLWLCQMEPVTAFPIQNKPLSHLLVDLFLGHGLEN